MIILSWHSPFSDCNTRTSFSKRFLRCTIKIMSFRTVIRLTRQPDNINAVPFASSMPEVVSISKYWKSNLEFYCSKTAFWSQSQFADDFSYLSTSHLQNPVLNHGIFVANQKAVCISLKYLGFHLQPDRSRSENGGPATYLATKIQQQGTSKRRKTSKGFYRKTYDYIKAYSPAMICFASTWTISSLMTVTSHRRSKSIKKLLTKIHHVNRAASLLVTSFKTSLGEGQFAMHRNMFPCSTWIICFYLFKWGACKLAVKLSSLPL